MIDFWWKNVYNGKFVAKRKKNGIMCHFATKLFVNRWHGNLSMPAYPHDNWSMSSEFGYTCNMSLATDIMLSRVLKLDVKRLAFCNGNN